MERSLEKVFNPRSIAVIGASEVPGKARELLFTAEYIDGKEAERIGLVNRAVPLDQLMDEAGKRQRKLPKILPFQ